MVNGERAALDTFATVVALVCIVTVTTTVVVLSIRSDRRMNRIADELRDEARKLLVPPPMPPHTEN